MSSISLLLLLLLSPAPPSRGVILDNLTDGQKAEFEALPDAERHFAVALLSGRTPPIRTNLDDIKRGQFFTLKADRFFDVNQVVDERNFLLSRSLKYGGKSKIIGGSLTRISSGTTVTETVWVEGLDTRDLKDEQRFEDTRVYYCPGNNQYQTAIGGSNTVTHLKTFTGNEIATLLKPLIEAHGYRIWGEGSAKIVIAKFVRLSRDRVSLETVRGKKTSVRLSKLNDADKEWVKAQ